MDPDTRRRWIAAATRPLHLAVASLGPALALLDGDLAWAIPAAAAGWAALALREASTPPAPPPDPLAAAGPEVAWGGVHVRDAAARALLARAEAVERRVTTLAREAPPETQATLVGALAEVRTAARAAAQLVAALDRVEASLGGATPASARVGAAWLHARALVQRDPAAAEALYAAAEARDRYAQKLAALRASRDRLRAEGEHLATSLEHAGLDAAAITARAAVRVRVDAEVVRAALAELDALEGALAGEDAATEAETRRAR